MIRDPLFALHRWEDGFVGYRLRPWAAVVNALLMSAFLWTLLIATGHLLWSMLP
jgi:hypothetical protein